jgi:hypothetical protein
MICDIVILEAKEQKILINSIEVDVLPESGETFYVKYGNIVGAFVVVDIAWSLSMTDDTPAIINKNESTSSLHVSIQLARIGTINVTNKDSDDVS